MQKKNNFSEVSESGVSEAIGFIIMFSIVLTGIAMVTLYAYPVLLESQINSDEKTMEQTLISLQNEMKILTYSNVPYRDIAIRVSGGSLDFKDSAKSSDYFEFNFFNYTSGANDNIPFYPGEIRYTSGEGSAVFTLENGAVISREKFQPGSAMAAEPRWYFDDSTDTLVVLLTKITADRDYSLQSIGNVQMSMLSEPVTTDMNYEAANAAGLAGASEYDVFLTYYPDSKNNLETAWRNYMTGDAISGSRHFRETPANVYQFDDVKRFVLKEYTIKIEDI